MIDELLLLSGNDIPFLKGQLIIHQPRLKEIAYISEKSFWSGCELLKFNKDFLTEKDKVDLSNTSNFNVIMTMINGKNIEAKKVKLDVFSLLSLLFPNDTIQIGKKTINICNQQTGDKKIITQDIFQDFKEILIDMFCLEGENKQYDPSGDLAKKIAEKIKRGREKKAKLAPGGESKIAILSRYASILAVGNHKSINDLMDYTVYQLMDEFNRYKLKMEYDIWIRFKCAGATGMKDPDDWLKDIHDNKIENDSNIITK